MHVHVHVHLAIASPKLGHGEVRMYDICCIDTRFPDQTPHDAQRVYNPVMNGPRYGKCCFFLMLLLWCIY